MGIAKFFEDVRKAQARHRVLAGIFFTAMNLVAFGGFWILIKYGADDDRYFFLGVGMLIVVFFALLPTIIPHD